MHARLITIIAASLVVAACATATPYAPSAGPGAYGYAEQQIEPQRFRVSFSGNSVTDLETVETYLLYRAAEITLQQGGDWFAIVDRDTERETRISGGSVFSPRYGGFSRRYYHRGYGWRYWHDPFYRDYDLNLREITRYESSAEIRVGSGPAPNSPNVYDARQVRAFLGDEIVLPVTP